VVGSIVNINMIYQFLTPGGIITDPGGSSWPFGFLNVQQNSVPIYFTCYFCTIALVHGLAKFQRDKLPDWRGEVCTRSEESE